MNTSSVNLFVNGFPSRVGDRTVGVVSFDLVVRERIDNIFLPQVLEEILLAPALEHAMSNNNSTQVPAARHHRCLMTGLRQAGHLTESKLVLEEADGLVMEKVCHAPTVQPGLVQGKPAFRDVADATLAVSQNVKAHGQQTAKLFRAPAAAVKNDGGMAARSQQLAHLA